MPYNPISGSISDLFPQGGGAPKPPMGQQLPGVAPPMPQQGGMDPQRTALLQALAQKIGGRGGM